MAQEKPQLKFERNPCIKFRDNCDTDGRTTDKNPIPSPLLTESSRAKNVREKKKKIQSRLRNSNFLQ